MQTKNLRLLIIFIAYLVPALAGLILAFSVIFPAQTFIYHQSNLDKADLILNPNNSFSLAPSNDFDQIKLELKLEQKPDQDQARQIMLKKGYAAQFYPVETQYNRSSLEYWLALYRGNYYLVRDQIKSLIPTRAILNSYSAVNPGSLKQLSDREFQELTLDKDLAGFHNGSLIRHSDAVFVIANQRKILVASARVFDRLGYDWDQVLISEPESARIHSKAPEPLTETSAHPDGTIFHYKDRPNFYYLINKGRQLKIDQAFYHTYFSQIQPIVIEKFKLNQQNQAWNKTCILSADNACAFKPDSSFKSARGNAYHFQLDPNLKISEIKVTFTRKLSWENLKIFKAKFQ
ncbi:MAG: hypothetical protein GF332_02640 [Candidatus Moranbacteria bacterium]|nr:hypothetical protein [Candidatus Moranbacteria bacterium]